MVSLLINSINLLLITCERKWMSFQQHHTWRDSTFSLSLFSSLSLSEISFCRLFCSLRCWKQKNIIKACPLHWSNSIRLGKTDEDSDFVTYTWNYSPGYFLLRLPVRLHHGLCARLWCIQHTHTSNQSHKKLPVVCHVLNTFSSAIEQRHQPPCASFLREVPHDGRGVLDNRNQDTPDKICQLSVSCVERLWLCYQLQIVHSTPHLGPSIS